MFTTVDMRKLQNRLNAMTEVAEEAAPIQQQPEEAPQVEEAPIENSNGDAELAELKDMLGRSGVMGFSQ
tara:strand:- start:1820 stop:2026 length:207 start_codon:yes stop_codon:yes gene_type:complete